MTEKRDADGETQMPDVPPPSKEETKAIELPIEEGDFDAQTR
ncbi:MAG: hypothetical protein ACK4SZ_15180 [Allosphingosinicella sp.]